jgi:hypothetical protein
VFEGGDLLLHAVLEDAEILLREIGDQMAVLVDYGGIANHHARLGTEERGRILLRSDDQHEKYCGPG